jgi:hypothetical protein
MRLKLGFLSALLIVEEWNWVNRGHVLPPCERIPQNTLGSVAPERRCLRITSLRFQP